MNFKRLFLLFFFLKVSFSYSINAYELDTILKPKQIIDSILLSEKLDWSVRILGNFKQQQFRLRNSTSKLFYKPNNPFGAGIGIANQKLVIDILFNIKNVEKEFQTKKFAAEGGLVLKQNYFGFIFENVHGYSITNTINNQEEFRKGLTIFTLGLDYLHLFSSDKFTVRMMKSAITNAKKSTVALGLGSFFVMNKLSSDNSILPETINPYFNDYAEITNFSGYGAGILGGISTYIALPAQFFMSFNVSPGIGLEYKKVKTLSETYIPKNPLVYKLNLFAGMGYSGKKYYAHFNFATNFFGTDLDFSNNGFLSVTKSKLIFGYNIGKINLRPKKKKAY